VVKKPTLNGGFTKIRSHFMQNIEFMQAHNVNVIEVHVNVIVKPLSPRYDSNVL